MKHLLIISRSSHPKGGADRIIANLCRQLPAHGWQVTLGLVKGARFNLPETYRKIHGDLPIVEIDGSAGTHHGRISAITKTVDGLRPDAVLVMRVFDAYEAVARIKQRDMEYQPRLVVGVRAYEDGYLADMRRYREVVDGCITSGRLIARALVERCGLDQNRVFSIAGGIEIPSNITARTSLSNPVRLLYAGRLEQAQKRVGDLVPFVERLAEQDLSFHLDIVGDGPEMETLKQRLDSWIRQGVVSFPGWVDADALKSTWYPQADIFVHFAEWEGVTIAPREAMAHGVVPVISDFTGLRTERMFIDGKNALVFPVGDAKTAADRVADLVSHPERFVRFSAAAAASNTGTYSASGAIHAWDQALRSVLEMQAMSGEFPTISYRTQGRLGSMGLPGWLEDAVRSRLHMPVRHNDPGSEWPTHSGLVMESERREFGEFARACDNQAST